MKIDPVIILRELDRRKQRAEERAAPTKAEIKALEAEHDGAIEAYKAMPWWKKLFTSYPDIPHRLWILMMVPPYDGAAYLKEHIDLYSLCHYARATGQDIEIRYHEN